MNVFLVGPEVTVPSLLVLMSETVLSEERALVPTGVGVRMDSLEWTVVLRSSVQCFPTVVAMEYVLTIKRVNVLRVLLE